MSERRLRILFARFETHRLETEIALEDFYHELDLLRGNGYQSKELKRMIGQIALYLSLDLDKKDFP